MNQNDLNIKFVDVVSQITDIGKQWHSNDLIENAKVNLPFCHKSFKDLAPLTQEKKRSAVVVSAGPSLHKFNVLQKLKSSNYTGTIVVVDGSLVKCLKNGIIPDYVLTLDPHPTRMVRWFGDNDFEENTRHDDYFSRQDLDVEFRNNSIKENQENIELINKYAPPDKACYLFISTKNVVDRAMEAGFDMYWWNPIVDAPQDPESLTRQIYNINKKSCMNTGGTVGTAAWVFANAILKIPEIAITGMDLGYHSDTPLEMTQTYYELQEFVSSRDELEQLFPRFTFPLTSEEFYTDPTYFWYRRNFLDLHSRSSGNTYNCSEAGTLFASDISCITFNDFLQKGH